MTAALLATAPSALAQTAPIGGGQLQQLPPTPDIPRAAPDIVVEPRAVQPDAGPAGPSVRIDMLRLSGTTLFDERTLLDAGGFAAGSTLTLGEMRSIAGRISAYYHARGYILAQAYLPAQDVQSGVLTIAVIEGRYGKVAIRNGPLSAGVASGIVRGLDSGDIVDSAPIERRLLLLSDLPGIAVKSTLSPGGGVGTSDLLVDITPGRRITGSVEGDNAGNRYTGAWRLGGTVNLNNPLGIGDQLSVRVLASTGGLAYGRIGYQLPVGALTLGAAFAHIRYELGREFDSLDADGTASIATLHASYPLIRSRRANLYALTAVEAKWFDDRVGLVSSQARKKSRVMTLGLRGDARDGASWTDAAVGVTLGDLDIQSPLERAADALTARADGGFGKAQFAIARLQALGGPLSLYAAIRGQIAFDNLDTSEKMELGGAYAVRAYPEGEAYGDQGYVATAEARLTVSHWVPSFPGALQAIAFVDVGRVDYAKNPWAAGTNDARRSGYGAGLNWSGADNLLLKASYARKLGDAAVTSGPDRSGRFWVQIVKIF